MPVQDTLQTGQPAGCLSELKRMASTAGDHAQALAQKQALDVAGVCEDLFCSPEIERQVRGRRRHLCVCVSASRGCHAGVRVCWYVFSFGLSS